jgi:hypothetical protein
MRLSADNRDPGYSPEHRHHIVILDGEIVCAITADEEEGYVLEWMKGPDGQYLTDENGHPVTRERRGGVVLQRTR